MQDNILPLISRIAPLFETDISVNGGVSEDKSHIQRKEKD